MCIWLSVWDNGRPALPHGPSATRIRRQRKFDESPGSSTTYLRPPILWRPCCLRVRWCSRGFMRVAQDCALEQRPSKIGAVALCSGTFSDWRRRSLSESRAFEAPSYLYSTAYKARMNGVGLRQCSPVDEPNRFGGQWRGWSPERTKPKLTVGNRRTGRRNPATSKAARPGIAGVGPLKWLSFPPTTGDSNWTLPRQGLLC